MVFPPPGFEGFDDSHNRFPESCGTHHWYYNQVLVWGQTLYWIADGILTLLCDPQRAAMFSQNGQWLVKEKFDMEKNVKKLEEVFEVEGGVGLQSRRKP